MSDTALFFILVAAPLGLVILFARSVVHWIAAARLKHLPSVDDVERRLQKQRGRARRFRLIAWEYELLKLEVKGHPASEVPSLVADSETRGRMIAEVTAMRWALARNLVWACIIVCPMPIAIALLIVGDLVSRDYIATALIGVFLALVVRFGVQLIGAFREPAQVARGRALLRLRRVQSAERIASLRSLAAEALAIEALANPTGVPEWSTEAGFSQGRETVTQRMLRGRWSARSATLTAVMGGGGLSLLKVIFKFAERSSVSLGEVAAYTVAAFLAIALVVWLVWRAWFKSRRRRERLLRHIGALAVLAEQLPNTHKALGYVAAAVGMTDTPTFYLLDSDAVNAIVTGTNPRDAVFVVTVPFARLPLGEQQAALAALMAHVASDRNALYSAPRERRPKAEEEQKMFLELSVANEFEGLHLTRAPHAHVALIERLLSSDAAFSQSEWLEPYSPFADRRLWYYVPIFAATPSLRARLTQLRNVLAAEAVGVGSSASIPASNPAAPAALVRPPRESRPALPPSARAVAFRAAAIAFSADRALIELALNDDSAEEDKAKATERVSEMRLWANYSGLYDVLTPREHELLDSPVGQTQEGLAISAVWGAETLSVLLWALGILGELPDWDTPFQRSLVPPELLGQDEDLLRMWIDTAILLPHEDIERVRNLAEVWHWRARTTQCEYEGIELPDGWTYPALCAEVAKAVAADGWFEPIGDDFPARGAAYRELNQEEWEEMRSIAFERHRACNWLCGTEEPWDEMPTDT